jgi:hypothetical protein
MPAFANSLTPAELDDIVTFLEARTTSGARAPDRPQRAQR